jgi:hypothetical protein
MKNWAMFGVLTVLAAAAPAGAAGDLTVVMNDGRVTVVAQNVPLRQILAEWSRVGQTKIVGAERLSGAPVTLRLENVPERQALETLLRTVSGYMAAPRPTMVMNASVYDRILILPTSTAPAVAAAGPAGRPSVPSMAPRPVRTQPVDEYADEPAELPEDVAEAQAQAEAEEAGDTQPGPVGNPYGNRPETQFDYANPQLMLQQRQQQLQQQQQPGTGAATPGAMVPGQPTQAPSPAVFPGTAMPVQQQQPTAPQRTPGTVGNTTTSRPGEMAPAPQGGVVNPYGLPAGVQPGSVQGSPVQPDRSKYMNPYQPTKPPGPGGN